MSESEAWQEAAHRWNDAAHKVAIYALQWIAGDPTRRALIPEHLSVAINRYHECAQEADLVTPPAATEKEGEKPI